MRALPDSLAEHRRRLAALAAMDAIDTVMTGPDLAALLRVNLTYLWRHRRLPRLAEPTLFTELVQLRKLHDRDPRMPIMADKIAVKSVVAKRLGLEWVVPTLWSGEVVPARSRWQQPIVVKSRHGCNQNLFVHPDQRDWAAVRKQAGRWMRRSYGAWLDEWLYDHIPRGILIEPFIGKARRLPVDYKIYVFDGQASHVQVHLDRGSNHRWIMHDTDWRTICGSAPSIPRPSALSAMIAAAEEMARGFAFARVDFYQPEDRPLFGEMTFYPGSGLDPFRPSRLDEQLGRLWLSADGVGSRARRGQHVATEQLAA